MRREVETGRREGYWLYIVASRLFLGLDPVLAMAAMLGGGCRGCYAPCETARIVAGVCLVELSKQAFEYRIHGCLYKHCNTTLRPNAAT
jgi:hypothetical protein